MHIVSLLYLQFSKPVVPCCLSRIAIEPYSLFKHKRSVVNTRSPEILRNTENFFRQEIMKII